jgi:hypothetical protein
MRGLEERAARDERRAERGREGAEAASQQKLKKAMDKLAAEQEKAKNRSLGKIHEKAEIETRKLAAVKADIGGLRKAVSEWREQLEAFAARVRVPRGVRAEPTGLFASVATDRIAASAGDVMDEDRALLEARRREMWVGIVRRISHIHFILLFLLVAGGAAAGVWSVRPDLIPRVQVIGPLVAGGAFVIGLAALHMMKSAARSLVGELRGRAEEMESALMHHEEESNKRILEGRHRQLETRIGAVTDLDDVFLGSIADAKKEAAAEAEDIGARHATLVRRMEQRRAKREQKARSWLESEDRAMEARQKKEQEELKAAKARAVEESGAAAAAAGDRLETEWAQSVEEFARTAGDIRRQCRERAPAWDDPAWERYRLPTEFPRAVYLGDAHADLSASGGRKGAGPFSLPENGRLGHPLSLGFPDQGHLLVSADVKGRQRGIDALVHASLRILGGFPAAKAKFLFIDPVGLGQSFSPLLHLGDHDDSLIGGRVWTETSHVEKKLTEVTEHIEKVIQKYLRNRYTSVDEYNREAGQLAEAYRFVVISDFPSGFSEHALERLASILTSGAKCGVHLLIEHDRRQKLPAAFDPARFRKTGLVLKATEEGLTLEDDALAQARMEVEPLPDPATLTSIVNTLGRQCKDASRVEVPFEAVSPADAAWGSASAESGIRIPVGRTGADRLQYLELGRGTAQHALVAGKTGSGKSTLFHVIVANAAQWFAPKELELYLIDFKKGVEFKRFATHRLPHARVVAIESDREFGLSVLRRLDRELTARAEVFRAAGVQDFAGYRREGKGPYIPRTLLLIDEFQEYFVEEDSVAQEASLLLDRIVRQGRAFGVHVMLGSQTLGGSYTLAKTTLGQMGVRIALQCNEADSLLILGEDNAAARLLSRPGEAIYNDQSGMIEGNSPFQVVWLSDEHEEKVLAKIRAYADAHRWAPREPTVVFEGNVPADIRNNEPLRERLARRPSAVEEGGARAWVGEANAIKGPTEVRFRRQGGGNLLIVGQQRESAVAVLAATAVGLSAAHPQGTARLLLLDGSPPESADPRHFQALADALPHRLEAVDYAKVPDLMEELDAEVKTRIENPGEARPSIYLFIHDLQRFRKLRQGDDYDFSAGEGGKPAPDKCLQNVLTEGPARGVHTIVWCDSLNNLKRSFSAKTLREFETRILFQMSASDSSELIDTPAASRLGLYRGLMYSEEEGTVEKFRPYALLDAERLEEIRRGLKGV